MPLCWQLVRGAAPAIRKWGDEYVVHQALSNDTYRLSGAAGQILTELMAAEGGHTGRSGSPSPAEDAETETSLSVLADLGFITQC